MKKTKCAGGVVVNPQGRILVVNQRGASWSLPKGHIEKGEDAFAAAEREIYEEAGVSQLAFIKELGVYERYKMNKQGGDDISELKTITLFLFKTTQMALQSHDERNPEARWVPVDEVATLLTSQKDKDFFQSILPEIKNL